MDHSTVEGEVTMRLYGYRESADDDVPGVLGEVTIAASPATLRRLAEFLVHVADEMDRHGAAFGREHFGDYAREMRSAPSFVVMR